VHLQKRPGNRFNAYDDLFSIRKEEEESLQTLINRVETAMSTIRKLRPSDFTLEKLNEELASEHSQRTMAVLYPLSFSKTHWTRLLFIRPLLQRRYNVIIVLLILLKWL